MAGFLARAASIRRIGPDYGQACAKIHAQSFAPPWDGGEFEALLAARNVVGHGAFASPLWGSKRLAGFILSRCAADTAEVLMVAVAPRARRKGLGGALLANHLAALATEGAKSLFLEVEAENRAALALYRRFDFCEVGERKAYYRKTDGSRAAALILRRDLD